MNAARTPKDAKKALISSSILVALCMVLVMVMGLSARVIMGEGIAERYESGHCGSYLGNSVEYKGQRMEGAAWIFWNRPLFWFRL